MTPALSIALLTSSTGPHGGVVHTLALAEALAALGQDVTVWALGRDGDTGFFRPVDPAVRQVIVPFAEAEEGESAGDRVLRSITVLGEAFDPSGYQVVHAQDCIGANAATAAGARCVRTVHRLERFTSPALAACHDRAIVDPCAHVCPSAAVAGELSDKWGISATVIPGGVDAPRFAAAAGDRRWRERLGRYVLAVGGIEPRKGSLDLLESYALLHRDAPDLRLVIAGGRTPEEHRSFRAEWERRAAVLGVEPLVLGPVAYQELPALVAAADVFAFLPTVEGFASAALEALAAGVPVIARDLPEFREVFGHTVRYAAEPYGFAAAMRDALARHSPAHARAGRAVAAAYSWRAAAERHLEFYRSLPAAGAAGG